MKHRCTVSPAGARLLKRLLLVPERLPAKVSAKRQDILIESEGVKLRGGRKRKALGQKLDFCSGKRMAGNVDHRTRGRRGART